MVTLPLAPEPTRTDRPGRLARYALRVSVLEQCQYRCLYCLPGTVTPYTARDRRLTAVDYARLAPLLVARGVTKVRFTGGEPLLRPDIVDVVRAFSASARSAGSLELALTTNGARLDAHLAPLVAAGVSRVTVHIDSLRPERYRAIMGEGDVGDVVDCIARAQVCLRELKVNCVVQRGQNDDELPDFLAWSKATGVQVRFIELMNTGSASTYTRAAFVSGSDIRARIAERGPVEGVARRDASDPAALYRTHDGVVFGVIASDTEPFCGACDRMRLTADGRLRGCLYEPGGVPLGAALHSGASTETLAALIDSGLDDKRSFHPLEAPSRVPFSMADVGG